MRCLSNLLLATTACADWRVLEDDSAIQLLQLKAAKLTAEEDQSRPSLSGVKEEDSMKAAECDIWARTHLYKAWRGSMVPWMPGWLYLPDDNGNTALRGDIKAGGVYAMATSKDERFKVQVFTSGWGSTNEIHAMAFDIDGTVVRVLGPAPRPLENTAKEYNENGVVGGVRGHGVYPVDPDAVLGVWANHKMRIRIGDKMYSQFDLPLTVPGTNIEITQHSWNMRPDVRLQSGLIIDNKDGFRAQVEQVSSNSDSLWMNVNLKFAPDNIPDPWADDLCGRGKDANPFCGDAQGEKSCGPDGEGDWASSLFTSEDHELICYAANRKWGSPASETPLCFPDDPYKSYTTVCKACSTHHAHDCNPEGDESEEARYKVVEAYSQIKMVRGSAYSICSSPPVPPPPPTPEELCGKIQCDFARGEELCLPVKAEGENEGGMYNDCLIEYCTECQEEAAQEFIGELEEAFPEEEDGDEAGAVGDPHLTTNGGRKFDLKGSP